MNHEDALKRHIELCDEAYALMLEENAHLKHHNASPEAPFLDRKKQLLAALEASVADLRAANEAPVRGNPRVRALAQAAQKKLMKIFLLDRENEQLLLKTSVRGPGAVAQRPVTANRVRSAYRAYGTPGGQPPRPPQG